MTTGREPWTVEDLLRMIASNVVAGTALVVAYLQAAVRSTVEAQLVLVHVAVAALVISGYANATWLLRGRRAAGRRSSLLLDKSWPSPPSPHHVQLEDAPDPALVGGDGLTLYHRGTCALAAGRTLIALSREGHEAAGRKPCGVCRP